MKFVLSITVTSMLAWPAIAKIACPTSNGGHRLQRSENGTLYEGDPSQRVAVRPDRTTGVGGRFTNTFRMLPNEKQVVVLVCNYEGGGTYSFPVPEGARICRQDATSFTCE